MKKIYSSIPTTADIEFVASIFDNECSKEIDDEALRLMFGHIRQASLEEHEIEFSDKPDNDNLPYIAYGKNYHLVISFKGGRTNVVLKMGRNLSIVYKETFDEIMSEVKLYYKFHKVLKGFGVDWPYWANRDSNRWIVREAESE